MKEEKDHKEKILKMGKVVKKEEEKIKKISKEDFNIIGVIGRGSFGKVYLVQMKNNLKYYAMKVLRKKMILERNQILHTKSKIE